MSHKLDSAIAVVGIDIGKNSFHVVGQDKRGALVLRQKWSRGQVEARLANLSPCLIGMEACVGAHHLSRKLQVLGHDARLMPAKYVRPYSKGQKNDFRDAEAIAEAVQRPTMPASPGRFSTRGALSSASRPMRQRPDLLDPRAVLGRGLATPEHEARPARRPALTTPARGASGTRRPGRRNGRQARTKEQREVKETIDDLANNFTRLGLREDETTMEDRSSRRMQTLVTPTARSRLVR